MRIPADGPIAGLLRGGRRVWGRDPGGVLFCQRLGAKASLRQWLLGAGPIFLVAASAAESRSFSRIFFPTMGARSPY